LTRDSIVKKQTSGIFKILQLKGGENCFMSMEKLEDQQQKFSSVIILADKQKN
jgi:hypothetical protein